MRTNGHLVWKKVEKSHNQLMQVVNRLEMSACSNASGLFNRLQKEEDADKRIVGAGIVKGNIISERIVHC